MAPLASPGAAPESLGPWPSSGEPDSSLRSDRPGRRLDALELLRDGEQRAAQRGRLEHAHQQVAGADLAFAEHQRAVDPAALDGVVDEARTGR
jgi:hypothetical protein